MKYVIHKNGKIYKFNRGRYVQKKPNVGANGYFKVGFFTKAGRVDALVHRLIAKGYIRNEINKPCVNHKNGIKTDNAVSNLEWCTYKENTAHSRKTGLQKSGHRGGCLSWDEFGKRWTCDITHFGKHYRKTSKLKSVVEEWMEKTLRQIRN